MARLNKPVPARKPDTKNAEGHPAYSLDAKARLYTRCVTSLLGEKKFYVKGADHDAAIAADIAEVAGIDPEFVLRLAAHGRNDMYLRSTPIFLLVQAAKLAQTKPFVRKWAPKIIRRADEPAEALGGYLALFGKPIPNALKKGVADAIGRFDEYQLEKYSSRSGAVSLGDAINIAHPKPADPARSAAYKYLVAGWDALAVEEKALLPKISAKRALVKCKDLNAEALALMEQASATWEVAISQFGNKAAVWDTLDLPYMAALRNLRNLIQSGANVQKVLNMLKTKENILRSKQLPFRFLSAYKELEAAGGDFEQRQSVQEALAVLSVALDLSIENIEKLPGRTAVFADTSGSMQSPISGKSKVTQMDIACTLAAMAGQICEAGVSAAFATDVAPVVFSPLEPTMTRVQKLRQADTKGWGTNGYRVMEWLLNPKSSGPNEGGGYGRGRSYKRPDMGTKPIAVDRIILLSDMQCYGGSTGWGYGGGTSMESRFNEYRQRVNPQAWLHSIDLAGYGNSQVKIDYEKRVSLIAGWSDKILAFIAKAEAGTGAVQHIETLTPENFK